MPLFENELISGRKQHAVTWAGCPFLTVKRAQLIILYLVFCLLSLVSEKASRSFLASQINRCVWVGVWLCECMCAHVCERPFKCNLFWHEQVVWHLDIIHEHMPIVQQEIPIIHLCEYTERLRKVGRSVVS